MSKAELARIRRISVGIGRSTDPGGSDGAGGKAIDGRARVLVPRDTAQGPGQPQTANPPDVAPTDSPRSNPTDIRLVADAVAALRDAVVALKERADGPETT